MSKTRVVHVNDNVPDAVYIGRANGRKGLKGSVWRNRYPVKQFGRRRAIELYADDLDHLLSSSSRQDILDQLWELRGKPLACWCRHDGQERTEANACHGDVLVAIIQELGIEPEETTE